MSPKDRPHRKKHLTHFEAAIDPAPEPDDAVEDTWEEVDVYDFSPEDRIVLRKETGSVRQLVDFAIQQETKVEGVWKPVRRYDCCHDMVHLDRFNKDGSRERAQKICGLDEIQNGYLIAESAIYDRWETEKERFLRG